VLRGCDIAGRDLVSRDDTSVFVQRPWQHLQPVDEVNPAVSAQDRECRET
jgi:hypothetical protein